jgi:hypothetical protein
MHRDQLSRCHSIYLVTLISESRFSSYEPIDERDADRLNKIPGGRVVTTMFP